MYRWFHRSLHNSGIVQLGHYGGEIRTEGPELGQHLKDKAAKQGGLRPVFPDDVRFLSAAMRTFKEVDFPLSLIRLDFRQEHR